MVHASFGEWHHGANLLRGTSRDAAQRCFQLGSLHCDPYHVIRLRNAGGTVYRDAERAERAFQRNFRGIAFQGLRPQNDRDRFAGLREGHGDDPAYASRSQYCMTHDRLQGPLGRTGFSLPGVLLFLQCSRKSEEDRLKPVLLPATIAVHCKPP